MKALSEARWALMAVETRAFILEEGSEEEEWALVPLLDILNTFTLPEALWESHLPMCLFHLVEFLYRSTARRVSLSGNSNKTFALPEDAEEAFYNCEWEPSGDGGIALVAQKRNICYLSCYDYYYYDELLLLVLLLLLLLL